MTDHLRDRIAAAVESEIYEYRERTMFWEETGGVTQEIARLATRGALEALLATGVDRETRIPLDGLTSDGLDQLYDDLDRYAEVVGEMNETAVRQEKTISETRATNQRLNLRAQRLESELAAYRRAVAQWEVDERGTYVPLRTLAAIAKAAGRDIENPRWLLHYQRVEQAETANDRLRSLLAEVLGQFQTLRHEHDPTGEVTHWQCRVLPYEYEKWREAAAGAAAQATDDPELTVQEARALADELGADLYRAQDRLAFIDELLDAAERDGTTTVDISRVRGWLDGPQCGMQLAAENPGLYEKLTALLSRPLPPAGDTAPAVALPCNHAQLRQSHDPHRWEPQPGMRTVQCPGYARVPAETETAKELS
jgi:hypothetical protein